MDVDPNVITAEAIDWHLRQSDMAEGDWADFVTWLETSPAHADAYDRVAMHDRLIGEARFPPEAANDSEPEDGAPSRFHRWRWAVGGVAAAAIAALLAPGLMPSASSSYEIATTAGEQRTVTLEDGTQIELNGDTKLKLDHAAPRFAELEQGEATLHVKHNASDPFKITSGGLTVQDVGTVFNLAREGDNLTVEVSEGSVLFEPGREAMTLNAGDAISVRQQSRQIARSKIAPEAVGGWRKGVLSFDDVPLATVFDSIHRRYGTVVVLEGDLPRQPFTGMVRMTGTADRDIPHLATMIGTSWRRDGDRWILGGAGNSAR